MRAGIGNAPEVAILGVATAGGAFFNLLKTPKQPLLVVGNEGLLKQLGGKMRGRKKKSV